MSEQQNRDCEGIEQLRMEIDKELRNMKVALCQLAIAYEKKEVNTRRVIQFMEQARSAGADLVLFPEMSLTGFSMNIGLTGERGRESVQRLCAAAKCIGIALGFGWTALTDGADDNAVSDRAQSETDDTSNDMQSEAGGTSDSMQRGIGGASNGMRAEMCSGNGCVRGENHYTMINAQGEVLSDYVKMHPFSYSGEDQYFVKGNAVVHFEISGIPFSSFICYDLRFPEIFQAASKRAHAIIVAADWPGSRREHWQCLLRARAIENQCYILGVNSVGDQNGLHYTGDSCVILPDGTVAAHLVDEEGLVFYDLSDDVEEYRQSFPMKQDRRTDLYIELYEKD